jgi:HPt (histidine-containing phosphotransfer) domain-containing protein
LNSVLNKHIRDKQPPEVIEKARQRMNVKSQQASDDVLSAADAPKFAEIFVRDANRSIAILDEFLRKGSSYNEEDLRTYVIYTHGIKSALANLGRMDLAAIALKLEQLGRENNIEAITAETPSFLGLLQECVNSISPIEDEPAIEVAGEDIPYLIEKLFIIKTACGEFDKRTAEEALGKLKQEAWSKHARQLLETISEFLLHGDFDEIIDAISAFMET